MRSWVKLQNGKIMAKIAVSTGLKKTSYTAGLITTSACNRSTCINHHAQTSCTLPKCWSHLEGVIGVRSLPIVWMTRRPQTHNPAQIPRPPYSSSQTGVAASCITPPWSYIIHRATKGPIALLQKRQKKNTEENYYKLYGDQAMWSLNQNLSWLWN